VQSPKNGGAYVIIYIMKMAINKAIIYLRMIKFSHSIFALPFAFTAAILAASGIPTSYQIFWITIAMVSARSAAMGLNRIIDREIDVLNPRTSKREIPAGKVKVIEAKIFVILFLFIFIFSAYKLNPLCLKLSPLAIVFLFLYSYTKRITWLSHLFLGITISAAPLGAWIAIKGSFDIEIVPLALAVIFWLAGFDILYALQDMEFDKKHGLHSIPQRFGIQKSLMISRFFHILTVLLLILTGIVFNLNFIYWLGLLVVSILLIYEHCLVKPTDLSKLNIAFFNMNGYISLTVFVFTFLAVMSKAILQY
jgi:4-hydroxybenzoate polyprenyltransferase